MVSREAVGKAPDRHPHLDFPALDTGGGQRVERYRVRKFLLDNDMRPVRRAVAVNRFDDLVIEGGGPMVYETPDRVRHAMRRALYGRHEVAARPGAPRAAATAVAGPQIGEYTNLKPIILL